MKKYLLFILTFLIGCGGSSGSSTNLLPLNPSNIPSISNLRTSPAVIQLNEGGGSVQVTISINFTDNDGDITTARYRDSSGADITQALAGFGGKTSATVYFVINVNTRTSRSITYEIWLIDGAANESNKLSGSIWVSW